MVSLVAEEVLNTSFSVSFPGNQSPIDAFEEISAPSFSVSGLTGFTYVETVLISFNATIDVTADSNNRELIIQVVTPDANFNGVDLFPEKNSSRIFEALDVDNPGDTFTINESAPILIDSYIDTPLELSPNFSADDTGATGDLFIDSQTTTFDIIITVVGRKP